MSLMPLAMNQYQDDHIIDLLLYITTKHSRWMGGYNVYCVLIGVHVCALQRVYVFTGAGLVGDYIRKRLCPAHGTRDRV